MPPLGETLSERVDPVVSEAACAPSWRTMPAPLVRHSGLSAPNLTQYPHDQSQKAHGNHVLEVNTDGSDVQGLSTRPSLPQSTTISWIP